MGPYERRPKIYDKPCGANNWLEVDIVGPADNNGAYRTQVWLNRETWVDRQQIESTVAVGQGPGTLHFGLGNQHTVPRLTVRWLDAEPTVLENFLLNRESHHLASRRPMNHPFRIGMNTHPNRLAVCLEEGAACRAVSLRR